MATVTNLRPEARGAATAAPALMSGDALVLEGVTRVFGALKAIDDVTFSVAAGERRAVLGHEEQLAVGRAQHLRHVGNRFGG